VVAVVGLVLLGLVAPVSASGAPAHVHRPAGTARAEVSRRTLHDLLSSYADKRRGTVTVAVYDAVAHRLIRVHHRQRMVTASIVKVDILQTLLHQRKGHLSTSERALATRMIEQSDNDAASDLWNDVGGASGVSRYDAALGLGQTRPHDDGEWGLTTTSATDQVALIRTLQGHSRVLSSASQDYEKSLMRHVTSSQHWGVSAGPGAGATVGLKNGWLPVSSDGYRWEVNSIGWVRSPSRRYVIAVLTAHQPSEEYGIDTIEHISRLVWAHVSRH
jgi:beta-lactamase class A